MIGYTTLGSNNVQAAAKFYDQLFAPLGATRFYDTEGFVGWGIDENSSMFAITTPYNAEAATAGNGTMVAIKVHDMDTVNLIHKTALELGATDEGAPGPRMGGYYCAYIRDLDGNKINFVAFQ